MAALTATSWTETVEERIIEGRKKRNRVKLALDDGGAFYPSSGGIPLPTTLGMVRNVDYVIIVQGLHAVSGATGAADNYIWNYVVTEHAIHGYGMAPTAYTGDATGFTELPTTWKPDDLGNAGDPVMCVEAVGW